METNSFINFSSAANKIQLEEFNQEYPEPEPKNETFDIDDYPF